MISRVKKPAGQKGRIAVERSRIVDFLDKELDIANIKDSSCNGLQVQGAGEVRKVGLAVDACMTAYRKAVEHECQMLLVHHGFIWNGIRSIAGPVYRHVKYLLDNNINLYAAHLPLDLHPGYGNNAHLCTVLGLRNRKPFGLYNGMQIGFEGELAEETPVAKLAGSLERALGGRCTVLPFGKPKVRRIAVVSGGAAEELTEAIGKGVDCYITGEPAHHNYHQALEAPVNVIYCGHYHSEKGGVQAAGRLLSRKFGVECEFLDIPTTI